MKPRKFTPREAFKIIEREGGSCVVKYMVNPNDVGRLRAKYETKFPWVPARGPLNNDLNFFGGTWGDIPKSSADVLNQKLSAIAANTNPFVTNVNHAFTNTTPSGSRLKIDLSSERLSEFEKETRLAFSDIPQFSGSRLWE